MIKHQCDMTSKKPIMSRLFSRQIPPINLRLSLPPPHRHQFKQGFKAILPNWGNKPDVERFGVILRNSHPRAQSLARGSTSPRDCHFLQSPFREMRKDCYSFFFALTPNGNRWNIQHSVSTAQSLPRGNRPKRKRGERYPPQAANENQLPSANANLRREPPSANAPSGNADKH